MQDCPLIWRKKRGYVATARASKFHKLAVAHSFFFVKLQQTVRVQRNHHFIAVLLLIWILNQGWNFFDKNRIDVFISPRFKCAIVDIFTMLMLRSSRVCLIKYVTYHSGWRPCGIVTYFIRQTREDRSITTLHASVECGCTFKNLYLEVKKSSICVV